MFAHGTLFAVVTSTYLLQQVYVFGLWLYPLFVIAPFRIVGDLRVTVLFVTDL